MKYIRSSGQTAVGPSDWFTGTVYLDSLRAPDEQSPLGCAHVRFAPGARMEVHPYFQRISGEQALRERGVQLEAWGQLAEGQHHLLQDPVLADIADGHGKSVAQVVLRWLM